MMTQSEEDAPGLVRYWFDFDVSDLGPPKTTGIILDGGTLARRLCGNGVGVTGFNREDCLAMIEAKLDGEPLPPITAEHPNIDVSQIRLLSLTSPPAVGVPVWRGIWSPPLNKAGPETA